MFDEVEVPALDLKELLAALEKCEVPVAFNCPGLQVREASPKAIDCDLRLDGIGEIFFQKIRSFWPFLGHPNPITFRPLIPSSRQTRSKVVVRVATSRVGLKNQRPATINEQKF